MVFGAIQFASSLLDSVAGPEKLLEFTTSANRPITRLKTHRMPLTFSPFANDSGSGRKAHVIAFPDASFCTFRGHGSIEGYCAFLDIPLKRDGSILRKGNLSTFYEGKISIASRPAAHNGGIAHCNASDTAIYLQ